MKDSVIKKLKEKIDYNFYQTNPDYGSRTSKQLPYSLIINWATRQIYIRKNRKLEDWGYIQISINGLKYRDIQDKIKMSYWTFNGLFDFEFFFNPVNENNFYDVIADLILELSKLYDLIEAQELDKNFVVPSDEWWLWGTIWWQNQEFDTNIFKLRRSEDDMWLDDIILEKEVRKKVWIMLLCIENREELEKNGWKIPKWYILRWKPWLWKTSLMKAILKDVNKHIEIFSISRKDYTSKWVWEWEKTFSKILNSIQEYGKKENKHCIIFFDEFDDIWKIRTNTHEAHAAELNVLLRFLDWLWSSDNITFIAWTNSSIEELDAAILRWWRTDDIIELKMPDKKMLQKYLEYRIWKFIDQEFFEQDIMNNDMYQIMEWLSFWDLNAIIIDLLNTRFIELKYWNLYTIDQVRFKNRIEEYKLNKWIIKWRIWFNI